MDSASSENIGEKTLTAGSVPGLTIPNNKWMARDINERFDYSDFCSSPNSSDGFFHLNKFQQRHQQQQLVQRKQQQNLQNNSTTSFDLSSKIASGMDRGPTTTCAPEVKGFFSSNSILSVTNPALLMFPTKVLKMTSLPESSCHPIDNSDSVQMSDHSRMNTRDMPDGKKLSQLEHVNKIGSSQNKLQIPNTESANTTPNTTPQPSPQVPRRGGNPFFTGTIQAANSASNWLFRSSRENLNEIASSPASSSSSSTSLITKSNTSLAINSTTSITKVPDGRVGYEPIETAQSSTTATAANVSNKKVRYMPKPSELRELNFWSPTSM